MIKAEVKGSFMAKLAYLLARGAVNDVKKKLDYSECLKSVYGRQDENSGLRIEPYQRVKINDAIKSDLIAKP
jgi:hypothetical protein